MNWLSQLGEIILWLVQGIWLFYLVLPMILVLLHFLRGRKHRDTLRKYPVQYDRDFDFAAIVTAHQDTRFILPLIDSCQKQRYGNFTLYVVADDCPDFTLDVDDPRVVLLKPQKALHSKIKSIQLAVDSFRKEHDVMVIFDSDNLLHPSYFYYLNEYYRRGFMAVQTHMLSKNTSTVYAKLDSIGHIYNTFVERSSKMELGLSSSILGLGISLKTSLYHEVMYKDNLGGFDKKLQADVIRTIPQLAFAREAIVYDEKVDEGQALERQRTRWIHTYFKYFKINLALLAYGLKTFNFNKAFFGFTTLRPPLFLLVIISLIAAGIWYFVNPWISLVWLAALFIFAASFVLIVITQSVQKGMSGALLFVPVIMFRQVVALLKLNKAKKSFLKTEHVQVIYIDEILKNESV